MPHCDTIDGPVVLAAKKALATGNINYINIWVPEQLEKELHVAFNKTLAVRSLGSKVRELADYWFWETAVRLHRAGEGEGFTGLKPAGLSEGPVVPRADKDIKRGSNTSDAVEYTIHAIKDELLKRYHHVLEKKRYNVDNVHAGREYIKAYINFVVYTHHLYSIVTESHGKDVHEGNGGHAH